MRRVSEQEELDRILPVIEALSAATHAVISIDSSKAGVMTAAAAAGAGLINDVYGLRRPGALEAAAATTSLSTNWMGECRSIVVPSPN